MTEKEIKHIFITSHLSNFEELIKAPKGKLRVYGIELPVKTADSVKYADVVCEIEEESYSKDNKMIVLEFKRHKVDALKSAVHQSMLYARFLQLQLYRSKKITPFIVAPKFSNFEVEMAYKNNVIPIAYDHKSGHMEIIKK